MDGAIVPRPDNFVKLGMREIHSAPKQPVNVGMRGVLPSAPSQAPRDSSCIKSIAVGAAGDWEFKASSSVVERHRPGRMSQNGFLDQFLPSLRLTSATSVGSLTGLSGGRPARTPATSSATPSAMLRRLSTVCAAECGVSITFLPTREIKG